MCKGSAHKSEHLFCLCVGVCGGYEYDIHTADLINLVILDLGEDELLLKAESVVTSAVEAVGVDTLEVTNSGESEAEELIHKLVHLLATESNLNADLHALTELEVCYGLVSIRAVLEL